MPTALAPCPPDRAPALIAHVESAAEARLVSHTHASALALARAEALLPDALVESVAEARLVSHTHASTLALTRVEVLLPDALVADLSARRMPDSATGVHRPR
ncbi:hypothetical protein ACFVAQ_28125 [Streptomyces sp. NPDC057651]|uniref:hypothetical protein n=1 Tax=Streptomyces sp. NPDC057651 TaxID=3346194 RepID=UPI0036AB9004